MRTLEFKARPTDVLFTAGGSSKLPTTAEHCFIVLIAHDNLINYRLLGSSRKLGGDTEHLIDDRKTRICRLSFSFRVHMLLKGTAKNYFKKKKTIGF